MDLGRKAIITGGSRGLGHAAAEILAAEGCDVAICSRGAIRRRRFIALPLATAPLRWLRLNSLIFLGFGFSCQREGGAADRLRVGAMSERRVGASVHSKNG
jgi:NAD(P)-dependent dehydrogenase (short-subunit alcohol dehydrogenase family)